MEGGSSGSGGRRVNNNSVGVTEVVEQQDIVIISQHEVVHHGHSHTHSHLHCMHENISNVAWMVILGDGMHYLADRLAIGMAFATGNLSGISTTPPVWQFSAMNCPMR